MRRQIASFVGAVGLTVSVFSMTAQVTRAQAAAEYRTRAGAAKAWPRAAVRGAKAMVATDEALGSNAGVEILKRGGNAVDAAVAVAFALAVGEAAGGKIGGGGVVLVRPGDGRAAFFLYCRG